MKKILSFLLVICFIFSSCSALGAEYDKAFDALSNTIYSGEFNMSIRTELNEPLLIAEVMQNLLFGEEANVPVDLKLLLESLFSSGIDAECTYNISKDYKKADLAMSFISSNPVMINESLKVAAWSKWDMWIQYDFISEVPVYRTIFKTPVSNKYIVMDMSEQLAQSPAMAVSMMPDAEKTALLQEKVISIYKNNSKATKKSNGYRITIDDTGFKNIFIGVFDIITELMNEQFLKLEMSKKDIIQANEGFEQIKEGINTSKDKFSILGKDGFTIDYKVNSLGFITESNSSANISVNVYDIMTAFGSEEECSDSGITKENSNIDFTIQITETISKHNQNIKVEYPHLTEENSYNPMSEIIHDGDFSSKYNYFSIEKDGVPMVENSVAYVKLRDVTDKCGFDLSYENGIIYVDTKTSDGTVLLMTNSNMLIKNGDTFELESFIIEKDGITYVTSETLSYLSTEITRVSYESRYDCTSIYFCYINPDYVEPEYDYEYEDEEYIEEGLSPYFWVEYEEAPVIKDGIIYIPLYPLLGEFNVATEEISVKDGEIFVSSDNSYIFNTLKFYENSVFTEKDYNQILLDNAVLNLNGNFWVGTDFAEKLLNSKLTELGFSGYYTTYEFEREVE